MRKGERKRPRAKGPSSVGDILKNLVQTTDLGKKLRQTAIWEHWPELAGRQLHRNGRPHGIRDKTLLVEVDGAVWMNRYAYHKWDIVKRINAMYGREEVSDLYVFLTPEEGGTPPAE